MAIRSISREEFQSLMPTHGLLRSVLGEPQEWFVDQDEQIIGTVAVGRTGKDWNFVVLGREPKGTFRAFVLERNLGSRGDAQAGLLRAMGEAEKGQRVPLPPPKRMLGNGLSN